MKCFLTTTPEYDDTTTYCSKWSEEVIKQAEEKGIQAINLNKEKAVRKNFEDRMHSNKPNFVMFNGHGNETTITGHEGQQLLSCQLKNEETTQNTMVYARSCNSATKLGRECVQKGCKAFIGYTQQYAFLYETTKTTTPTKDETASHFFNVSNTIPKSILKGDTPKQATQKADVQLQKQVDYLKTHYNPEAQNIIPWLLWNKTIRTIIGDEHARI